MNPLELHRNRLAHSMAVEAEVLLSLIAEYGPLTIMQVLDYAREEQLASLATVHKYLTHIREADLVEESSNEKDHRTKYLDVSKKGIRYLRSLT
jgi:DNA-binding MarR family transcriptional regulator